MPDPFPPMTLTQSLSQALKQIFWEFVRGDMSVADFEHWVYTNQELEQTLSKDCYLQMLGINYKNSGEVRSLIESLRHFLVMLKEPCQCLSFTNHTKLYPFDCKQELALFQLMTEVKGFYGNPPADTNFFYYSAGLYCCKACQTWWFKVFEENGVDDYLVRLDKDEAKIIEACPTWPNDNWPVRLKDWHNFLSLSFKTWSKIDG